MRVWALQHLFSVWWVVHGGFKGLFSGFWCGMVVFCFLFFVVFCFLGWFLCYGVWTLFGFLFERVIVVDVSDPFVDVRVTVEVEGRKWGLVFSVPVWDAAGGAGAGGGGGGGGGMATGGYVRGPGSGTSDDIKTWLSNGEYVVKAASVKKYGLGMLNAINAGRAPKFAAGGL